MTQFVGSICRKGDHHYRATDLAGEIETAVAYWADPTVLSLKVKTTTKGLITLEYKYHNNIPSKHCRGGLQGV